MSKITYELLGSEIVEPTNFRDLEIELNFDTDGAKQALSINDWEFGVMNKTGNDGAYILKNEFKDKYGVGILEGKEFKIKYQAKSGNNYTLFDGYVDLWKAQYDNGKVTAPAVQTGSIDWLNDYADSFSFEYLYSIGYFGKSYFVPVPYLIVKKQDQFEIAMTLVTVFIISDKIKDQITEIAKLVANSVNPMEMTAIPRLILQVAYLVVLFASLIPLIVKLITMLVPPVRYHNVMYIKDLFKIGCAYMDLTFKSSIIDSPIWSRAVILPEKYNLNEKNTGLLSGLVGDFKNKNEKVGYFKGTFGDFLRAMKAMFYGKIVISDGVLNFEPFNFKLGNNGITIPTRFDNKDTFSLNHEDFYSTLVLSFLTDLQDRHTIQEYKGTSVQVNQVPKTAVFKRRSLMRGFDDNRIPFALAKTKTELTFIEDILVDFLESIQLGLSILITTINIAIIAINALIAVINGVLKILSSLGIKIKLKLAPIKSIQPPSLPDLINKRLGILKMESDFVSVPKIFLINQSETASNTKMSSDNQTFVNAAYLFAKYYAYKLFVSTNGNPSNQFILKSNEKFPFSSADYEQVLNNNSIFTDEGGEGELISLKFNPVAQTASCTYKVRSEYISNLKLEIVEPDGE